MPSIPFEQALYLRLDQQAPALIARSPGMDDAWLPELEALILGFGDRPGSMPCPLSIFARPITKNHIAVVRVRDDISLNARTGLRFHFLIVKRNSYEAWIRDPFLLAAKIEPTWDARDSLPVLMIPEAAFQPRTVAQLQEVLKRVKAYALKEGEDPEAADFERTVENSESPALLGSAQILVDGGQVVFERPEGDLALAAGLWLLLPEGTRSVLWPTSFAFSAELGFDLLIVPRLDEAVQQGYTTEAQAAGYPQGAYELALQKAVEAGDQRELDAVFSRRDSNQTIRLALILVIALSLMVLASRWLGVGEAPPERPRTVPTRVQVNAAATGIVGVGDPWTSLGMLTYWKMLAQEQEASRDAK